MLRWRHRKGLGWLVIVLVGEGRAVNTGDLPGPESAGFPARVRAAIVASKSGNSDGANGGRKGDPKQAHILHPESRFLTEFWIE